MTSGPARLLRDLIANRGAPILVPGAANALSARVIQESGFRAVYVTGAGVTNTFMGMPDLGLLSLSDLVAHVSAMADAVELPLLVDADTGFGNAINVRHTVRSLERAGAAAIQIEARLRAVAGGIIKNRPRRRTRQFQLLRQRVEVSPGRQDFFSGSGPR